MGAVTERGSHNVGDYLELHINGQQEIARRRDAGINQYCFLCNAFAQYVVRSHKNQRYGHVFIITPVEIIRPVSSLNRPDIVYGGQCYAAKDDSKAKEGKNENRPILPFGRPTVSAVSVESIESVFLENRAFR